MTESFFFILGAFVQVVKSGWGSWSCWLWRLLMLCDHSQLLKEWTQAPGQVEQSHHAHAACGWPSLRTWNTFFLCGCQLRWLAESLIWHPSRSTKVWEGWQRHLLLSLLKKQKQCATGWHMVIFIAMKMSTITADSAAWGGGGDLLETPWAWQVKISVVVQVQLRAQCPRSHPSLLSENTSYLTKDKSPGVKWYLYNVGNQGTRIWMKNGKTSYWPLPGSF